MTAGRVLAIHIARRRGEPMTRIAEVEAHAGAGLAGDRYLDRSGSFSRKANAAQHLSLIEAEAFEALERETGIVLEPHLSRRNILTRGISLNDLVGREFTVGEVSLRGMELCHPCGHMEKLSGVKGARAGLVNRGGLRCQILAGGLIREGDAIRAAGAERAAPAEPRAPEPDRLPAPAAGGAEHHAAETALASEPEPPAEIADVDAMEFCFVPGGPFVLGSEGDPLAWEGELAEAVYDLPYGYWLARYPVSNAQFRQFADDLGYREAEFWTEAAEAGAWNGGLLEAPEVGAPETGPRDLGRPFNEAGHPASGTTWYEALAFCRWLTRRWRAAGRLDSGLCASLPSEVEWEKGARGGLEIPDRIARVRGDAARAQLACRLATNPQPRRRFPWGDEADARRANFAASGVGTTSRLGRFPGGASPYGVEELSGNVWEWTRSLWADAPYPADAAGRLERERLCPGALRTLRGGGFNFREALVRCSARHCHSPLMRYRHVGFRVCLAPAPAS